MKVSLRQKPNKHHTISCPKHGLTPFVDLIKNGKVKGVICYRCSGELSKKGE